jgi:deoxyribose-phosphate aldolase
MKTALAPKDLARLIDHTLLRPEAAAQQIDKLCAEARQHHFYSVCVNGSRVAHAYALLEDTEVKVCSVAGFPLGAMDSDVKRYEAEVAIDHGAAEIDVVLNLGRLKDGDHKFILRELRDVVEAAEERPVKVILETALLTRDEKILGCHLAVESGAQFVKTSTGFGPGGATVEDVKLLRETVGDQFGVKASGGVRDARAAFALIEAGATRLGTSASLAIIAGLKDSALATG